MFRTLKRKMLAGTGLSLLLTCLVLYWSLWNISRFEKESYRSLQEKYRVLSLIQSMLDDLVIQNHLLFHSAVLHQPVPDAFNHRWNHFGKTLAILHDEIVLPEAKQRLNSIRIQYERIMAAYECHESEGWQSEEGRRAALDIQKVLRSLSDQCVDLRSMTEHQIKKAMSNAIRISRKTAVTIFLAGVVFIGIAMGFGLYLSQRFLRPLNRVVMAMKSLGDGNYRIRLDSDCDDEFEKLACEFNAMASMLQSYHELNIEELFREKRKNELMVQNIDDAVILIDEAFRISDLNPAALHVLEAREKRDIVGKKLIDVIGNEKLCSYIKDAAKTGKPLHLKDGQNIVTARYDNDEHRFFQFSIIPVKPDEGDLSGVILLFKDVTGLKELDRLKSEFVMIASHELRTPLTSIGMSIDLLRETTFDKLSDDEKALLMAAHEDIERLKNLVQDLLNLSKIEVGRIEMVFEPVSIEFLFEKIVSQLKPQADEKGIKLFYNRVDKLGAVIVDADKILWVLNNLISNALRYTNKGGYVRLTAECTGDVVRIGVHDNGIGIPEAYHKKIFDKFVQIKDGRSVSGSGLGLAICREIIRAHGGSIWVESEGGVGSTFFFTLPDVPPGKKKKDEGT